MRALLALFSLACLSFAAPSAFAQTASENAASFKKAGVPAFMVRVNSPADDNESCHKKIVAFAKENGVYYPGGDVKYMIYFLVMPNKSETEIADVKRGLITLFPKAEIRRTTSDKLSDDFFKMVGK